MFKIGTGEQDTEAGRVYAQASAADREGEVTWVYCQGKLWARRVNEGELGQLIIYDPSTLKQESTVKIVLNTPVADN